MTFLIAAAGLTLIIALWAFFPLLITRRQTTGGQRDDLNRKLYFSRLTELEREAELGLLDDMGQAKGELQKTLLDDVPSADMSPALPVERSERLGKIWFVSGFLTLAIVSGGVYAVVGAWQAESMLEKTYQKLPHFYERLKEEDTAPLNDTEMQQFATALRLDLQKNPNDAKKWWLLGQLGMNLGNPTLAFESFRQAHRRQPENPEYKLAYARLLMFSDDETDKRQGSELLREVIRADHANLDALSLLALRYFETEDYKMAAVTWAMMLRLMPPEDERVPLLEKSIRAARDALTLQEEEKSKSVTPNK